jgi:hypothetical protein
MWDLSAGPAWSFAANPGIQLIRLSTEFETLFWRRTQFDRQEVFTGGILLAEP